MITIARFVFDLSAPIIIELIIDKKSRIIRVYFSVKIFLNLLRRFGIIPKSNLIKISSCISFVRVWPISYLNN